MSGVIKATHKDLVRTMREAAAYQISSAVSGRYGANYHSNEDAKVARSLWAKAEAMASDLDKGV